MQLNCIQVFISQTSRMDLLSAPQCPSLLHFKELESLLPTQCFHLVSPFKHAYACFNKIRWCFLSPFLHWSAANSQKWKRSQGNVQLAFVPCLRNADKGLRIVEGIPNEKISSPGTGLTMNVSFISVFLFLRIDVRTVFPPCPSLRICVYRFTLVCKFCSGGPARSFKEYYLHIAHYLRTCWSKTKKIRCCHLFGATVLNEPVRTIYYYF